MASYRIDYKKSPKENVVGIINAKNEKSYPSKRILIRGVEDDFSIGGSDTKLKVDLLNNGKDTPNEYVEFCFARIKLEDVFKNVDLAKLDKMLPSHVIENGFVIVSSFIKEMHRRFGFYLDETNYDYVVIDNVITVHAKAINPLYKGFFEITVEGNVKLEGEEANKIVEDFSDYLLKIDVFPDSLSERDFEGAIKARSFISSVEDTDTIVGAMVFKNGDRLEFVSDVRAIRQAFKSNKLSASSTAPINPIEYDLWIEDE